MRSLEFETPLGTLRARLRIDGKESAHTPLLLEACQFLMESLPESEIAGGQLVTFRLESTHAVRQLKLNLRWAAGESGLRGKPECDDGVNGLRFTSDTYTVLLATEDVDALQKRVHQENRISAGAAPYLHDLSPKLDHLVFGFHDDGVSIRLTDMPANESVELHFAVAWNPIPEPTPEATWHACTSAFDR